MKLLFKTYDEMVKIADLQESPYQTNTHTDAQIERLAYVMREDGVTKPIECVRGTKRIWAGHGRLAAAKLNGWTEFPVVYHDFDSSDHEFRMGTSDNIGQQARVDYGLVNEKLELVGPFDIELLALPDFKVDAAEVEMPSLSDAERGEVGQMTFTLTHSQIAEVKNAIRVALDSGPFGETGNENRNGNAIARVCEWFFSKHG